jgi:hypothetical protein
VPKKIRLKTSSIEAIAELNDTETASAIWNTLPFEGEINTWGDEIYFAIPLKLELERGQELVELGDMGYWPPGNAFCVFFGLTPASQGKEIRPASPVTIIGRVISDPQIFHQATSGEQILVDKIEDL